VTGETFGVMLGRLRVMAGLSQNQLARQAGCDPAYVNRLERGISYQRKDGQASTVSRTLVLSFAEVLDVSQAQADRLLYAAGLAPQVDWQTRAVRAETSIARIREAMADLAQVDDEPTFIRSRVG
jgi:transcriptional regulator with XRE-family HTH domain